MKERAAFVRRCSEAGEIVGAECRGVRAEEQRAIGVPQAGSWASIENNSERVSDGGNGVHKKCEVKNIEIWTRRSLQTATLVGRDEEMLHLRAYHHQQRCGPKKLTYLAITVRFAVILLSASTP